MLSGNECVDLVFMMNASRCATEARIVADSQTSRYRPITRPGVKGKLRECVNAGLEVEERKFEERSA